MVGWELVGGLLGSRWTLVECWWELVGRRREVDWRLVGG